MKSFYLYFLAISVCLCACGPNQNLTIKNVDVSTREVGDYTYVDMQAVVVMGNLKFPNIELPIFNPSTRESYGQIALQSLADGTNQLSLLIDYNTAIKQDGTQIGKTLPNGREIPISLGANNVTLIGIPIFEKSRIYIGGELKKDLFIGTAISIPAFDNALKGVGMPLNVFFSFPFSFATTAIGGFFTGANNGENGIAVFAKKSNQMTINQKSTTLLTHAEPENNSSSNEAEKLDRYSIYKFNRLLRKNIVLRIK